MKRILVLLALAALCAGCDSKPGGSAQKEVEVKSDRPAIVFLGDSLTAGYRLPPEDAFPARLQHKMDDAGLQYKVINAGRSGDTTAGGLARLPWYLRKSVHLKILVIELGSNDAMRGQDLGQTEKNLIEIIHKTRAFDPNVKILVMGMHTFPNMGPEYAGKFTALFPRVAKQENVPLLPFLLEGVASKPGLNQDDGIHPTTQGAVIVAENVWKGLRPYL